MGKRHEGRETGWERRAGRCAAWMLAIIGIILGMPGLAETEAAEEMTAATITVDTVPDWTGISNEAAAEGFISRMMSGGIASGPRLMGKSSAALAGAKLSGGERALYDALKEKAQQVAAGQVEITEFAIPVKDVYADLHYTAAELGVDAITSENAKAVMGTAIGKLPVNTGKVLSALLADMPYEMFWFDKTIGMTSGYSFGYSETEMYFANYETETFTVRMRVAKEYSVSDAQGTTAFNRALYGGASKAAENARAIITENAGKGDYEKLTGYKDAICERTDYNEEAAGTNKPPYGNPWQMVWVFDGNPNTKVVCEGYSKAFQYLCDESAFTGNVYSTIASGVMTGGTGEGGHMWNIVTMTDGKKYLADITNSDQGTVGQNGGLFLDGYDSTTEQNGKTVYWYEAGSREIGYQFDNDMTELYGAADLDMIGGLPYGNLCGILGDITTDVGNLGMADPADPKVTFTVQTDITADYLTLKDADGNILHQWPAKENCTDDSGRRTWNVTHTYDTYADQVNNSLGCGLTSDTVLDSKPVTVRVRYTIGENGVLKSFRDRGQVVIPEGLGITAIGESIVGINGMQEDLISIVIPEGVTVIGGSAFSGAAALTTVTLPETLTTIQDGAFSDTPALETLYIPESVTHIAESAFKNWDSSYTPSISYLCGSYAETWHQEHPEINGEVRHIPGGKEYAWAENYSTLQERPTCLKCGCGFGDYAGVDLNGYSLTYTFHEDRTDLDLAPKTGAADSIHLEDLEHQGPANFSAEDIVWGSDTSVRIEWGKESTRIIMLNGKTDPGSGKRIGISRLFIGNGGRVIVNCPVQKLQVEQDRDGGNLCMEINNEVADGGDFQLFGENNEIFLGDDGKLGIRSGTNVWRRMFSNWQFGAVSGSSVLFSGGTLHAFSAREEQSLQFILPSDEEVSRKMNTYSEGGEAATLEAEKRNADSLTEAEKAALTELFGTASESLIDSVFDLGVAIYTDREEETPTAWTADVLEPFYVSVKNETGEAVCLVRLYENVDRITAEKLTELTAEDKITFACDKFSVSRNQPFTRYLLMREPDPDSLKKLTLPEGLTRIEDQAFTGGAFEAVIVPDGCEYIGHEAFLNCENLIYVSLPAGAYAETDAFSGSPLQKTETR